MNTASITEVPETPTVDQRAGKQTAFARGLTDLGRQLDALFQRCNDYCRNGSVLTPSRYGASGEGVDGTIFSLH